jgi:hypothetical protein
MLLGEEKSFSSDEADTEELVLYFLLNPKKRRRYARKDDDNEPAYNPSLWRFHHSARILYRTVSGLGWIALR